MKKLRSLLVGSGHWAENHVKAYQLCREVELAGICDVIKTSRPRLDEIGDRYGISARYQDLRQAIKDLKPDIVDIAANPHYRLDAVKTAMAPCIKLFNIEKPMALNPEDAYAIVDLCRKNRKLITVGHQKKWMPSWAEARKIIQGGELGRILFYRATSRGNLLEQGTHLVDMVLFLHGYKPVTEVMGQVADLQGLDKAGAPAPDAALACFRFEDDARAHITCGTSGYDISGEKEFWFQMGVEAYGTKGHLKNSLNQPMQVTTYKNGRTRMIESDWWKTWQRGLSSHLDAAARYARQPKIGHISCIANSMLSFNIIMGIYASACGAGRVALPCRFDNSVMKKLDALRKRQR